MINNGTKLYHTPTLLELVKLTTLINKWQHIAPKGYMLLALQGNDRLHEGHQMHFAEEVAPSGFSRLFREYDMRTTAVYFASCGGRDFEGTRAKFL